MTRPEQNFDSISAGGGRDKHLEHVGVTGFGTLIYGSYRVGTPVWGEVYEGFSCMKDHQDHILCIVV
jgi:hypothetical protein